MTKLEFFKTGVEVGNALRQDRPVVALESTIIAFGLPWPENLQTALECEAIAREEGAVPATVGVARGVLKTGLDREELETFAQSEAVTKTNLSNLSAVCAHGFWGATSVSTSLLGAALAGVSVFATGGIGGVHRDYARRLDISSDLKALAEYDGIVVSAGVKSLLDVAATREQLETLGITVLGWQTDCFAMFYTPASSCGVDMKVETPEQAAAIYRARKALGQKGAVLVAAPIPEGDAMSPVEVESFNRAAEEDLSRHPEITGRAITPYLLKRMEEISGGKTLRANLSLIRNNVRIASRIAVELARQV